jgi:hypothetical protein
VGYRFLYRVLAGWRVSIFPSSEGEQEEASHEAL